MVDMENTQDTEVPQLDPIDDFHKALIAKGYKLPDIKTFRSGISDPERRKKLYTAMVNEGDYTKSYNDFDSQFFASVPVKKKETTSSVSSPVAQQPTKPSVPIQNSFGIETPNTTQETQSIIGGQPLPASNPIAISQDPMAVAKANAAKSDNIPAELFQQGTTTTDFDVNGVKGKVTNYDYQNKPEAAKQLQEKDTAKLNFNELAKEKTTKEKYASKERTKNVNPNDINFVTQNFGATDEKTQTAMLQYLDDMKLEQPERYKQLVDRIYVGETGGEPIFDQATGATMVNPSTPIDLRLNPKEAFQLADEATSRRIQEKQRNLNIYASRKAQGKGTVDNEDALSTYEDLEKIKEDRKKLVYQFPEEANRQFKEKINNAEQAASGSKLKQSFFAASNALVGAYTSMVRFTRDATNKVAGNESSYTYIDKALDEFSTAAENLKGYDASKEDLSLGNAVPKVVGQVANMAAMFAGGAALGGGKAAVALSGAMTQYEGFRKEAEGKGLSEQQITNYALAQAFIQGSMENINPKFGFLKNSGGKISNTLVDFITKNPNATYKEIVKEGMKGILEENTQEVTQMVGEKATNWVANKLVEADKFETQITGKELLETIVLTTLTTGATNTATGIMGKADYDKTISKLVENPEQTNQLIDRLVTEGKATKEEAATAKETIKAKAKEVEQGAAVSPTPSAETPKAAEKVQEVNLESVTKDELLNENTQSSQLTKNKAIDIVADAIKDAGDDNSKDDTNTDIDKRLQKKWQEIYRDKGNVDLDEGFANTNAFNSAVSDGSDQLASHGMAKSGLGSALNDLERLLANGIDPNRGGGKLDTAPLTNSSNAQYGTTGGGTSYRDGAFILVAKKGEALGGITDINQVGGILVNNGIADSHPEIIDLLREKYPNLIVESYNNVKGMTEQLNSKSVANTATTEQSEPSRQSKAESSVVESNTESVVETTTPTTDTPSVKQPKKIKIDDETGAIVLEGDNGYNVSIVKKTGQGKGVVSESQDFATEKEANDFVESKKAQPIDKIPPIENSEQSPKIFEADKKFGRTSKDVSVGQEISQSINGSSFNTKVTDISPIKIEGFNRDTHIVESESDGQKYYQVYDSKTGLSISTNAETDKDVAVSAAKKRIEKAKKEGDFEKKISENEEVINYNNKRKAESTAAKNELKSKKQAQNKKIIKSVAEGKETTFKPTKNKGEFTNTNGDTVTESSRVVDGKKYVTVKTKDGVELSFNRPTSVSQKTALAVIENTLSKNPIVNNSENKDANSQSLKNIVSDFEKAGFTFSKGSLESIVSVQNKEDIKGDSNNEREQRDGEKSGNEQGVESQMNDSWRKEFERAKSENDLKALDTLYSKVRVVLNGIAQSKGDATVKAFQDFKKEMEDYAGELKAKKEVFKPNTPTEINDTNLVESIDGAEQHIEEVKAALDTEIAKAELDLKRAGRETLMNAGLPINPRQIEAATKLVYLKFKKFMYDTGIAPKLQEMADAIGVVVSERFKGIYDNVKAIWSIENSSGFHESLGYFAQARRMFQDKNLAIKTLFKDLEKMNVPIDDSTNFAEIQELTTSRIADAQRRAAEWFRGLKGGDKILGTTESKKQSWVGRVIAEVGSYETQRDYMYAKHALDYNARAREIFEKRREEAIKPLQEEADALTEAFLKETDPKEQKKLQDKITKLNNEITELENEVVPDRPSGYYDAEAQAILDEAAKDPAKMAKMDALAKEFRDNTVVKRIDLLEKSGMIDAKTAQNMREGKREGFTTEMPNYLPLKVKSENFTDGMRPTTSMGKLGTQIFGIQVTDKYGKAQRYDPLQMAMTELQATQSAAINNEALVSLYNAVKQSPFGKNIKIINSRGTYAANEHGELTDTKTDANVEVRDLLNDHAIPFKIDGKIKYLFFTPIKNEKGQLTQHPIIQALKANPASTGTFAKALLNVVRTMTNYLRLIRTTYNLGFAADNPFRDLGEALTNISDLDKDGMKVEKVRLQIIKNMPTAFGFFFNPSKKRLSLKGRTLTVEQEKEFQKYWDEMRENGVMMSWGNYEGIDEKIDDFEKDIQRMEQGKFGKTGAEQAATTFKVLGALSEATENTTRIAVFAAMRQNGYSAQKAAYVAKNVTLNFEKGGTATKWTNMLWMFSNAGIQGTTRMLKAAKSKNFWRFGATMTAFAFANRSLLLSLMDDDDEDKWIYNNLENKGRTLIYNPLDPKNPIRLPKPYSAMRLFLNLGEGMADIKNGKRTTSDVAVDNIASTLTSSIDPIGGSGNSLTNYVPFEPLRNFVQIRANQNWAGQEIMRGEDKLEDKKIADHLRSNPSTDAIFDKAALGLYNTTGLSVQPTTIEYFWDDYGKNAAKSVTDYVKIGSIIYDKTTGKEVKAEEIPAIKRFYTNVDDKRGTVLYGVMDLIKDPTQGTPEQIRYIEKQLPKLEADKTISQYFIKRIKDGLAEMKDPTIKQKRDAKNTGDFEKNIELKESKQTVKQIKG